MVYLTWLLPTTSDKIYWRNKLFKFDSAISKSITSENLMPFLSKHLILELMEIYLLYILKIKKNDKSILKI